MKEKSLEKSNIFEQKADFGVISRMGKIIEYYKLNKKRFAERLGYANSEKIARLFRGKGALPSYEIIYDISNKFENINIDWLIAGRGSMFRDSFLGSVISEETVIYEKQSRLEEDAILEKVIINQQKQIDLLHEEVKELLSLINPLINSQNLIADEKKMKEIVKALPKK